MRCKLSSDYELCGFKNLPFAVMDKRTKDYRFMDREGWITLQRAAYGHRFTEGELDEKQQKLLDNLIAGGVVVPAEDDEQVPIPPYRLYKNRFKPSVQWSITGRCNARCRHCFMSAPEAKMGEPTLEQCLDIIKMLDECGTRQVSITGGEPFVRRDFWQIIDAMREHDLMLTTLYSNGILVSQELLDGFKKRGMHPSWQISFDGINGAHDWMRGVKGATDYALNAIRLLKENGFGVGCATSLWKDNVDTFGETVELLAGMGVSNIKTGTMQQQGEWLKYPDHWLTHEQELEFYMDYLPKYIQSGRPVNLQCEGIFMGYSDNRLNAGREHMKAECEACAAQGSCHEPGTEGHPEKPRTWSIMMERACPAEREYKLCACEVLRKNYYIGATGAVLPCMSLEGTPAGDKFPNLFRQPLSEILTDSYYTRMADATIGDVNDHNPECRDCEYRLVCGSGCRAGAVGADGDDYLAMDKHTCMQVKEGWPAKIRAAIEAVVGTGD